MHGTTNIKFVKESVDASMYCI